MGVNCTRWTSTSFRIRSISNPKKPTFSRSPALRWSSRLAFDEMAAFEYVRDYKSNERPFKIIGLPPGSRLPSSNITWTKCEAQRIVDIRGEERRFRLDEHGFCVRHWPTRLSSCDFDDRNTINMSYLPEIEDMLRRTVDGADIVKTIRFQVRYSSLYREHKTDRRLP